MDERDLAVRIADTDRKRTDAFDVRHAVFVAEQGVDEELEYDDHDETATHFVAYDGAEPIGAARLREPEDGVGKIERVAVLESRREEGVGRALMATLERRAADEGLTTLKLHSQTHAADFYRELGYERHGSEFEEAGIPHVEMRKSLA
ncbi:GCN5-related N-acetyltransferase [Natrinema pellirubrum DSM 15624]|uniref:Acyltransferase n=1 Tax=Natrinema pellirubrum (strain DSM 15624 / CIP 106293 / JCM 10476 / NCIMB 786 / 157) TaxID=797303 RepID=L0JRJ0_NATP1|nr:GNAT family N-acetyltransferase [Natrinema pellirubrum]AGB33242.1 putative acyltransferase [Natrinema pellirubrum DSM 15624]ELY71607.1 GCN5-related N-acetyltransferase [Natrinema pellirubrum DSM 15624]